jgi:hypothetical protein
MTVPAPARAPTGDVIESVIARGDLAKLNPEERTRYYVQLCQSLGLNPHTQPFAYITLSGKLTLYAKRDAADQLRKIHGISISIVSQEARDDLLTIHVKAIDRDGRSDEDLGVVPFPAALKGEARSNAVMKAITKAKRRVTLSISGLGFLDESEVDSVPSARRPPAPAPNVMEPPHDPETGEIIEEESPPAAPSTSPAATTASSPQFHAEDDGAVPDEHQMALDEEARMAAVRGREAFEVLWKRLNYDERRSLNPIMSELEALTREADAASH